MRKCELKDMAHSAAIGAGLALVLIGIGWAALLITLAASDNGLASAPSLTAQPMTERSVLLAAADASSQRAR